MANSNGVITVPVSLRDVCAVLGVTNQSVAHVCGNTHGKTNMWSRYKPVHIYGTLFVDRDVQWWKGSSGTAGFSFPSVNNYSEIPGKYTSGKMNGWLYVPPSGGATSPYRLGDFEKYKHDAIAPISTFVCPKKIVAGDSFSCSCMGAADTDIEKDTPGSVSFSDISRDSLPLSEWYFGIVVTDASGTVKGRVAGPGKGPTATCTFDAATLTKGETYDVYPFLARNAMTQTSADITNTYIPLPLVSPGSVEVSTAADVYDITITLDGEYSRSPITNEKIAVTWSLEVKVKSTITINSGTVYVVTTDFNFGDTLQSYEGYTALDAATVTSSKPYTKLGMFSGIDKQRSYKILLYLNTNVGVLTREKLLFETS